MTQQTQKPQQGIFAPYMKHYGQTPEEQLEKNKSRMERLKKWIEETEAEKITKEEAKAREQQWEEFKQIIDSFRPAGHKLYTEKMIIFIDSGVLGVLSSSSKTDIVFQSKQWFYQLLARGVYVTSSELCDYEVRRSLLLNQIKNPVAIQSINNLDELQTLIDFLPLTSPVMKQSASYGQKFVVKDYLLLKSKILMLMSLLAQLVNYFNKNIPDKD